MSNASPVHMRLKTDKDGYPVLVLGSKEIGIGDDNTYEVDIVDVRNAAVADLPTSVTLRLDEDFFDILLQRTPQNTAMVRTGASIAHKVWGFNVGVRAYFEMLELSIKCHPRHLVSLWIDEIDTEDPYWTHFWFRSEFHESSIGGVMNQVSLLLSELVKEVAGVEDLIEKTLDSMRSAIASKSHQAGPTDDLDG